MKHYFHILLTILTILIIGLTGFAQQNKEPDLMNDNIESMLPPLETIIDSAIAKNPFVKFRDLQITVNTHKLKSDRADWTRDIGFQTDVRYGTFDNFASNVVQGQNPALISTRNTQTNYGVGAYIRIPFYDFLNRKNQIKLSKAEIEQAKSYSMVQRNELRQLVIRQYNEVIIKQRLLRIKTKYTETSRIHMQMVEKQFISGAITLTEYSSLSEIASRAESDLESSKMEFRTAYMILEEIVGMKFNLNNK
ncbi:MAG: TolC family protein [Bacteroidia bacterium]|nr:TolC family protein [Bacteroidia bacterium]